MFEFVRHQMNQFKHDLRTIHNVKNVQDCDFCVLLFVSYMSCRSCQLDFEGKLGKTV